MLDGGSIPIYLNRFDLPVSELRSIVEEQRKARGDCNLCLEQIPRGSTGVWQDSWLVRDGVTPLWRDWVYHTPWEDNPHEIRFCSENCEEEYLHSGDFSYFYCEGCNREVCEQNPRNGWMIQYRITNDSEQVCLRCYEEDILKNGQPDEDYEGDKINGGMFFSYGNLEPLRADYETLLEDFFIGSSQAAAEYNKMARDYINQGYQLITCYERLAIGGLEGTITLMGKRRSE